MCTHSPKRFFIPGPPLWGAVIILALLAVLLFSSTSSSAGVAAPAGENPLGSDITPTQSTLGPGQKLTLTITLRNSGDASTVANVTAWWPADLAYVPGSVTGGGDPQSDHIDWADIPLAAGASVPLTFQVTPAGPITSSKEVNVVAGIMTIQWHFLRMAHITLAPSGLPTPSYNLTGSYKSATQFELTAGKLLTYTIHLHNSGAAGAVVDVTDPVPEHMSLSSVLDGGSYDPGAAQVSWNDVSVPAGEDATLSFSVVGGAVAHPVVVVNTATISLGGNAALERRAYVLLAPTASPTDVIPPVVNSLTIDGQDVLTSRGVTLHINASDNVAVTQMYVREWQLATGGIPHWEVVQSSGWVPYQADYAWTLGSANGTHYVGVWVADAGRNTSHLSGRGLDFASLVQPGAQVSDYGTRAYLVDYGAGVAVNAALGNVSGSAELYVWYPGSFGLADREGTSVSFTTPRAGVYVFLVRGLPAATYDLSITPGGGPRVVLAGEIAGMDAAVGAPPTGDVSNPLVASGLDPLSDSTVASADPPSDPPYRVYLPMIGK